MRTALEEARRIAGGIARQRRDVATRREALACLEPVDLVQVVGEDGRLSPPTMLWAVEEGPVCVLADWSRQGGAWQYHERRFNADGEELGGGRVLVVPSLTPQQAHEAREAQFSRWARALDDRERAYNAALPDWLQALIRGDWLKEAAREEVAREDPREVERRAADHILATIPTGGDDAT